MSDSSSSVDWNSLSQSLNSAHIPEIFLIVMGAIALFIVYMYLSDKDSAKYKLSVLIGVIAGIIMAILCATSTLSATKGTLIIVVIGCFALIIRPFRDVHFAVIIAICVMVIAYIALGDLTGNLEVLSSGWQRIVAAFVLGAIAYMLLQFLQEIVLLLAKLLNAWPVLGVLGVICIIEGICVLTGNGSVYDMIKGFINCQSGNIALLLGFF